LIDNAAAIAVVFEANVTEGDTKASPNIWSDAAGFSAKAQAFADAAAALDATSLDGIKAGMGAVGGACGGCHQAFRM
jgi:cytochrome c556